ncbi:MAG: ribose-phosphate diphosphokinase [Planctomycetota bacterium]
MTDDEIMVFGGSASPALTAAVCAELGVAGARCEALRFPDGNLFVRVGENVRGREVYLVQGTAEPVNDNVMELLFWIDALKRASAASVTAVVPYFSYAKGDKKDEPRVSIRARVCADAIEAAGVDRVVTVDLHAPQIQGFFRRPVDDLYAAPTLCRAARCLGLTEPVVVSPDTGFAKKARLYADRLDAPLAVADKQRIGHGGAMVIRDVIGNVRGRQSLIVDDFTVSGGTLVKVAEALVDRGATAVMAAVTHGVFTQRCMERLDGGPLERLLVTDTVEGLDVALSPKVEVVSLAPLLAEAIRRIHTRRSISVLFNEGATP